ncbi:hypothetical protein MRB53_011094 [Persea americana]|uniref:Uncharacterized protein n=1 Tax=Persea americana TaxID=3435 RepID=A0ACC2LUK9_PERAE|nr:hypothetical protein MRB53_011094 [Persea americana]
MVNLSCPPKKPLLSLKSYLTGEKEEKATEVGEEQCSTFLAGYKMEGKDNGFAIGIDLGTTYSCVGVWKYDHIEIIPNDQGNRITPSCVAFTDEMRLTGDAAANQASVNSVNTIFGELAKS